MFFYSQQGVSVSEILIFKAKQLFIVGALGPVVWPTESSLQPQLLGLCYSKYFHPKTVTVRGR